MASYVVSNDDIKNFLNLSSNYLGFLSVKKNIFILLLETLKKTLPCTSLNRYLILTMLKEYTQRTSLLQEEIKKNSL